MATQTVITEKDYKKMKEELDYLKNVKRKEISQSIGVARSFGDLSENSEYKAAKEEQEKTEAEITELEETLAHVKVIGDHEIRTDIVGVGVSVVVHDMDYDEDDEYHLVGSTSVNSFENKISDQSPLGKALIGSKVGDVVTAEVPAGTIKLKIVEIKKYEE